MAERMRYPESESEFQRQDDEWEQEDRERAMRRARTEDEYLEARHGICGCGEQSTQLFEVWASSGMWDLIRQYARSGSANAAAVLRKYERTW